MADRLSNWEEISAQNKTGFLGEPQLMTLLPGTKIYRLDNSDHPGWANEANPTDKMLNGLSGWWSLVDPSQYKFDRAMSVKEVYETAVINGIDFSSMVRYFSAVKLEWNDLTNYVEVAIGAQPINAWYGRFAPMSLSDGLDKVKYAEMVAKAKAKAKADPTIRMPKSPKQLRDNLKAQDQAYASMSEEFLLGQTKDAADHWKSVNLANAGMTQDEVDKIALLSGMSLGIFEAYQLFIPKFQNLHLAGGISRTFFNAKTQMRELGQHLRSAITPDSVAQERAESIRRIEMEKKKSLPGH